MARNMPRMVGMAALLLPLLLLSGTATATSYPSADQYSLRNHYRITRRSAGHEILPTVSTDYDEDEERQRQAVSLTELLQLWEPEHREEERRPQRGDIEVTTKGVERGDVPVIGKRRKLVRRQAQDQMWGFAEEDGMQTSDDEARPTPHPRRKHHRNSGLIETQGDNDRMRWRGPEEEMRQRPGLKDRRILDEEARRRQQEEQRQSLYEMRRMPEETQRRDSPRQHEHRNPAQSDENETRRRQQEEQRQRLYEMRRTHEETQRRENPRQHELRNPAQTDENETRRKQEEEQRQRLYEMRRTQEETQRRDSQRQHELRNPAQTDENETRRRQEEEQRQRAAAYDLRRRQDEQQRRENSRQSDNDRRRQPDNRGDETRRRQEQEERQRAYEARRREEEQRQSENDDRRKQPDNRDDETRRRQEQEERQRAYEARRREEEQRQSANDDRRKQPDNPDDETRRRQEQEERQRAYEARRREEEQRQRGRNPPTDTGDTYEKRMQEWRKMKEEHDRLVRERQQQQHHPRQDPQRPEAQTKNQDELENEQKLQEYIRRNTPIVVPPSANRDPASDRIRENEQVRRAEHERRLEEERRRKQVQEESRRLAEEERMRRTHDGATDAGRDKSKHRGTSSVRPRWPAITSRTPVENSSSSRRPIPQNRHAENDARYLESRRNEAAASNSRRPSLETEEEEEQLKKLKGMPVSATIIVRSTDTGANRTNTSPPALNLRFGENIDFPGFSPNRRGPEASRFPAPVTRRPPVPSPQPCVWAIVVCCQQHRQQEPNQAIKVTRCFEATNCPGASWDVDRRCSEANVRAANEEIRQFYLKGQERNY